VGSAKSAMVLLPGKSAAGKPSLSRALLNLVEERGSRVDASAALSRRRVGDALTMSTYPKGLRSPFLLVLLRTSR
jgi:chloramphenicol 3-O-phosphotransferase